jgi:ubiquinone/menaquinone biosynthesis C-methylase UbiE
LSKPPSSNEFDAYRLSYGDAVNKSISFSGLDVDFFTRAKAVRLLDILTDLIGPPGALSLLDVGCGVGNYHGLLQGRVGRLTGVDPSSECIEEAKSKNPNVFYQVNGDVLPFQDNCFDATYAICVMHHVPPANWNMFAAELARVTKPGGVVLIFEHNPYNPLTRRAVSDCPFDKDAVLLPKAKTIGYLKGAGLAGVEGRYILAIPSIDGLSRKMDDALGRIPLGAQYYAYGRRQ